MDFIEQWFGISPDGGDGSLETLIVCAALTVVAAVVFRARILWVLRKMLGGRSVGGP